MTSPATDIARLDRLLQVIGQDILPLTEAGVQAGNKVFGAALVFKKDLALYLAATNDELRSPLLHGEMHLLEQYFAQPAAERPAPEDLWFLATHEPCSLCLSAITWSGFDNFHFLFSHEDSRDAFAIPHDLRILQEVFGVAPGQYHRSNAFWTSYSLREMIRALPEVEQAAREQQVNAITARYAALSDTYQRNKGDNSIPLS